MTEKIKNMLSAVRLWAWAGGMSVINGACMDSLIAEKNGAKITFITEFDKTHDELLKRIAAIKSDYIYVVTDDNAKRQTLIKAIPKKCGILCYGNPFGLGCVYQVLKEPK